MDMKIAYQKSLQMIKILKIRTEKEYVKILNDYLLLSLPSLKYVTGKTDFDEIVKLAKRR